MSEMLKCIERHSIEGFAVHELNVRLDCGLYRSYRCQKPESWIYGFDVTFTPGWVFISGDIGHLALSREADMLPWLRGVLTRNTIDLRYVAEKAPQDITTRTWCERAAHGMLDRILAEGLGDDIDHEKRLELHNFSDSHDWEHTVVPELLDLGCHDFYEYGDASDWNSNFIWCVLGLKWCVNAIDQAEEALVEG